jgi:hypothetical protein
MTKTRVGVDRLRPQLFMVLTGMTDKMGREIPEEPYRIPPN